MNKEETDSITTWTIGIYAASIQRQLFTRKAVMQWLQEKGKLETFYARIRDGKDEQPQDALRAIFGNKFTIDEIESQVYAWVKTL